MNRFKIAISISSMVQVMIAAALATQAVDPPIYRLSPLYALVLLIANAGLIYLNAQMPSWKDSTRASDAIDRMPPAPVPPRVPGQE